MSYMPGGLIHPSTVLYLSVARGEVVPVFSFQYVFFLLIRLLHTAVLFCKSVQQLWSAGGYTLNCCASRKAKMAAVGLTVLSKLAISQHV